MLTTLPEPWLTLKAKYGGVRKLCKYLGVPPNSFYQWVHGKRTPGASAQRLMNLFLEAHDYPPQTWKEEPDASPK